MAGSLLAPGADAPELSPIWRAYWARFWHRIPQWKERRLRGYLTAAEGRTEELLPVPGEVQELDADRRRILRPRLVHDYPDGTAPFLGVITLGGEHEAATESGVLQLNDAGHLLTVAPTRTGKGASQIVPNLLLYAGSAVVIDIKGENYDVTAEFRRRIFPGARVIRFAPFEEGTDCYNPLDFVRAHPHGGPGVDTFDDARLLADMLVPTKAKEEYWDVESRNLVTMLLMYVASRYPRMAPERTMAEVARLLFRVEAGDDAKGFDITAREIMEYAQEVAYRPLWALVAGFLEHEPKVRKNILSSCRAVMLIWNSERLQHATSRSDFTFADLKASMCRPIADNPAPTTLYVVVPPEYLQAYRSVVRIMVGLGVIELTREGYWKSYAHEGWRPEPPCPVLFLLDELPTLGHMDPIVNGLAYLAGYKVQLWAFAQNLGQLKEIYGEAWHNFPANAAVSCFFGVNDPETAEFVSRQLGESEEEIDTYYTSSDSSTDSRSTSSSSDGYNSSSGSSSTSGSQEHVRFVKEPLATPSDVRALHKDLQFLFVRNRKPILSTRLDYYNFPLFDQLYGQWRLGTADAGARS